MAYFLNYCAKIAVLFVPFLLLYIYYWYGREKSFTVPEYLSTIPNPALKPWQVNLLFKGDALRISMRMAITPHCSISIGKRSSLSLKKEKERELKSGCSPVRQPIPMSSACSDLSIL